MRWRWQALDGSPRRARNSRKAGRSTRNDPSSDKPWLGWRLAIRGGRDGRQPLSADAVVAVAVEDDPERCRGFLADGPEAMRHLRVECDRVARPQLELLEADLDAEASTNHVGVFVAAVPDERVFRARLGVDVVHDQQKLHFLVRCRREALPPHAVGEADALALRRM